MDIVDAWVPPRAAPDEVTALYQSHALGLVRLAVIMLGDTSNALAYVRSSVLNGCRTALRRRSRHDGIVLAEPAVESAEASALVGEEHREVLAAIRRLPDRQREALVLRFYLDMAEDEIAQTMRISRGTVRSATSRAIATLGRMIREGS